MLSAPARPICDLVAAKQQHISLLAEAICKLGWNNTCTSADHLLAAFDVLTLLAPSSPTKMQASFWLAGAATSFGDEGTVPLLSMIQGHNIILHQASRSLALEESKLALMLVMASDM